MHYGFRIIEDLCDGLSNWMDEKGFKKISDVVGQSVHRISDFKNFDLSFKAVARIDQQKCIRCNLCYVACNDTAHQCIDLVAKDGSIVPPGSYDVRSNGKRSCPYAPERFTFAKRIVLAAACVSMSARSTAASAWWRNRRAAHP
jgi:ferredoxin